MIENNILPMLDLGEFNRIQVVPLSVQVVTSGKSGLLPGSRTILDRDRPCLLGRVREL